MKYLLALICLTLVSCEVYDYGNVRGVSLVPTYGYNYMPVTRVTHDYYCQPRANWRPVCVDYYWTPSGYVSRARY